MENTDIRDFQTDTRFDLIVGDISFISLTKLMDSILSLAVAPRASGDESRFSSFAEILLLYKPQFEVGPENLRKTGVPKSEAIVEKTFREFQSSLLER